MVGLDEYIKEILDVNGPLKHYRVQFGLDKLTPGIDNIRYDVNISVTFRDTTTQLVGKIIIAEVKKLGGHLIEKNNSRIDTEWNDFQNGFSEILLSAVNKAKQVREPQIVSLAQAAVTKMCREIIQSQFGDLVKKYRKQIRKHEISRSHDLTSLFRSKESMALLQQNLIPITSHVAKELMKNIMEAWERDIHKSYIANFGSRVLVPREFFYNPVLFVNGAIDDFFMIREYVLLGHRMNDPLRYDALLTMIKQFLEEVLPFHPPAKDPLVVGGIRYKSQGSERDQANTRDEREQELDSILSCVGNIDLLFNFLLSQDDWAEKKKKNAPREDLDDLKRLAMAQKQLLSAFYDHCRKTGLMDPIMAYYGIQPVLSVYCPPLLPNDLLNYFVNKRERKKVLDKLKRLKSRSGYQVPLKPLFKAARTYRRVTKTKKFEYLLAFLRAFATYHRDFKNFQLISENLQWVNLLDDEKRINLSRVNRTLYEFYRRDEQLPERRPVRNHVIIKADVRGSTELTSRLSDKRLNPASYFSLNFFDPITEILPEYNAAKVFIEGDALILSIVEKEETPEDWYAVARACGLSIRILRIVKQHNEESRKHQLPILEQGIGICYLDTSPTYLFDGDNRIMISAAISRADRLSGCHKGLRKHLENKMETFNLFVFMSSSAGPVPDDSDYLRFNVNGIQLDNFAFHKLSREIDLKQMVLNIPEVSKSKISVYTGIFPTQSRQYQRIVIREAMIPIINPETFRLEGMTSERYYEVCTSPLIYDHVNKALL